MSERKVGHCLPLYLKHGLLLSTLEDEAGVALVSTEDRGMLNQFRERASEQAVRLLEDLYEELLCSAASPVPYRKDRRSQRRTVRENWYMEGRLYRPRERLARAYWRLALGCLRAKGPAAAFVVGPTDSASPLTFDELSVQVATTLGLESVNPRTCFIDAADFGAGIVVSFADLVVGTPHVSLAVTMKERLKAFFLTYRVQLEERLGE
jgi:hypothetical protein